VLADTPLWVPLVVAGIGVLGTILGTLGGVLIAQRRSDRREDLAWTRQQEREREQWEREDQARTFEHRREAYADFIESLRQMAVRVYDHGMGLSPDQEFGEWQLPTFRRLQHLRLYATPSVPDAANEAYTAAWWWGHGKYNDADDQYHEAQELYDSAEDVLMMLVRADLSIPD
jgi:hypothetical protein